MSNDVQINMNTLFLFDDKDEQSLEKNHTHFLLLDDGNYLSQYIENGAEKISTANDSPLEWSEQSQIGLLKTKLENTSTFFTIDTDRRYGWFRHKKSEVGTEIYAS